MKLTVILSSKYFITNPRFKNSKRPIKLTKEAQSKNLDNFLYSEQRGIICTILD